MKQITIAGRIGKDAEVRNTQNGESVASWSVAVDDRQGQERGTIWFDCSLWGKRGASLAPHIRKGDRIAVTGDLGTREHNGKTYLTVRADNVTLLGDSGRRDEPARDERAPAGGQRRRAAADLDDDIPFAPEWRA